MVDGRALGEAAAIPLRMSTAITLLTRRGSAALLARHEGRASPNFRHVDRTHGTRGRNALGWTRDPVRRDPAEGSIAWTIPFSMSGGTLPLRRPQRHLP
jgi:hypothetical protein